MAVLARLGADSWVALAVAGALVAICFAATGGIENMDGTGLTANVTLQMALTLGGGLAIAAACAQRPRGRVRLWGLGTAVALFAVGAFTAISIAWSVDPASSWLEASRTFAYGATFAGAVAAVRLGSARWRSVLLGVALATAVVSAYALAAKIVPEALDASDPYARLQLPFGYWNAVGLTAALGVVPCLWLGTRREGHGVFNALSAPALCLLAVTLLLSYSRGALAAAVIGAAFFVAVAPVRLRALALLGVSGVPAAGVIGWAYRQPSLTNDHVALPLRSAAGHRLGLVLAAGMLVAFAAALAARFLSDRQPLSASRRRRIGLVALVVLALVPVGGVAALAHSQRGLTGTISHAWSTLTNPHAIQPSSNPGRLIAAGNDHALYWSYAIDVFDASPFVGAGAGAYPVAYERFMTGPAFADQAHSYVFQTLADLGLAGLALSLIAAAAWGVAAVRATSLTRPRAPGADGAERIGLVAMVSIVLVFAVHSAVDWTWFVPGDALVALLCAGWVAGRGRSTEPGAAAAPSWSSLIASRRAVIAAAAAVAIAVATAWAQWQPLRSEQVGSAGAVALAAGRLHVARADALAAISRDPLDITPLNTLALSYAAEGNDRAAKATFAREVSLAPSNAQSWIDRATYEYAIADHRAAEADLARAIYLYPWKPGLQKQFIATLR